MAKPPFGMHIVGEQQITELVPGRRWRIVREHNGLNVAMVEEYIDVTNGDPARFNGVTYAAKTLRVAEFAFSNEGMPSERFKVTIELWFNPQTWDRPEEDRNLDLLPFDWLQLPE